MEASTLTINASKLTFVSTLQERIAEIMAAANLTVGQIAELTGVSSSAVTQWKDGPTKTIKASPATKLAAKTGYSAIWISTGEGAKRLAPQHSSISSEVGDRIELREMRKIPVVGEVKGGDDGYLEELEYPVGHGEGFVLYPTNDPNAYAVRVRGDSMHPRYRAGEFVIVEPNIEAQEGDDVVVACTNGKKMLKQLNWRRDGEIQLLSINNGYGPLTVYEHEIQAIQLVAGRARRNALQF